MRAAALVVLGLLALPQGAAAQAAPVELALTGHVEHPGHFGLADLQALPAASVEIAPMTMHGPQKGSFTGVPLWVLVHAAAPIDEPGEKRTTLQHTVLARGRDGYAVALALGELDPDFEGKPVLVAYEQDGKALAALRLVVPLDAKAGRSVRDLVAIEVR